MTNGTCDSLDEKVHTLHGVGSNIIYTIQRFELRYKDLSEICLRFVWVVILNIADLSNKC